MELPNLSAAILIVVQVLFCKIVRVLSTTKCPTHRLVSPIKLNFSESKNLSLNRTFTQDTCIQTIYCTYRLSRSKYSIKTKSLFPESNIIRRKPHNLINPPGSPKGHPLYQLFH